jgi:hypothetical protein
MKKCTKCKTEKEVTEFTKVKQRKDGLCVYCRSCEREIRKGKSKENVERAKQWKLNNKEKYKENQKRYRDSAKPCCYIFKHNEFFYIGATKQHTGRRFTSHKFNLRTQLGYYIKKHNLEKKDFELQTTYFETIKEARKYEKELICKHIEDPKCLNTRRY